MRSYMDRIVFFSESNIQGRVPRDFENARTEFGWSIMLDAEWCPIGVKPNKKYDLGIIIIPKNNPNVNIENFKQQSLQNMFIPFGVEMIITLVDLPEEIVGYTDEKNCSAI